MFRLGRIAFLLLVWLAACADDERRAQLVRIESVEQLWEKPLEARLRGDGFPVGARGEARLEGTLFAPEARARKVALTFPCRALNGNEALIELRSGQTAELPEGPFEGSLEVAFGNLGAARIVGRVEHMIVRVGEASAGLSRTFAQRKRAQAYQRSLGLAGLELTEHGVMVSQLESNSSAALAGVARGDIIVRAFGAPVQLPNDVWRNLNEGQRELEVKRHGESGRRVLKLPTPHVASSSPLLIALAAVLSAALGALLGTTLRTGTLWLPRSREYWLSLSCIASLTTLAFWLLQSAPAGFRAAGHTGLCALLGAFLLVCLVRRMRPTLRTERDPSLAPLL